MSGIEQQNSSKQIPSPNDSINDADELESDIIEAGTSKKGRVMALDYSELAIMEGYPHAIKSAACRATDIDSKMRLMLVISTIIDAKAFQISKRLSTF